MISGSGGVQQSGACDLGVQAQGLFVCLNDQRWSESMRPRLRRWIDNNGCHKKFQDGGGKTAIVRGTSVRCCALCIASKSRLHDVSKSQPHRGRAFKPAALKDASMPLVGVYD